MWMNIWDIPIQNLGGPRGNVLDAIPNGDFIDTEVEWMKNRDEISRISIATEEEALTLSEKVVTGSDVSRLAGKPVKLVFRMRGSKLYAMKFAAK